jgi:hypothetical protein
MPENWKRSTNAPAPASFGTFQMERILNQTINNYWYVKIFKLLHAM